MVLRHAGVAILCCSIAACGGGSSSTPTPPTSPGPQTPTSWTLSGRVVSTQSGDPVAGAAVQAPDLSATTSSDGRFTWTRSSAPGGPLRTAITADGFLRRETGIAWPRSGPDPQLDIISLAAPFSLTLYQQLVRDALESAEMLPLYRWTTRPRVALHPFDDSGRPLPPEVVATIRATVPLAVEAWSGGLYQGVQLEETQVADWAQGWIVMHALRPESSDFCGQASFAYLGEGQIVTGRIELTLDRCACGSRKISPNTVSHELAHALGFWHAQGPYLLTTQTGSGCSSFENEVITPAERAHARIAYSRPPGNRDPDTDPQSFSAISRGPGGRSRTVTCQ